MAVKIPSIKRLGQVKQCRSCPWRKESTVADIPGYDSEAHTKTLNALTSRGMEHDLERLASGAAIKVMACHQSKIKAEYACIGWLHNQLFSGGTGFIAKIMFAQCTDLDRIELDGPQVESFEQTIK